MTYRRGATTIAAISAAISSQPASPSGAARYPTIAPSSTHTAIQAMKRTIGGQDTL